MLLLSLVSLGAKAEDKVITLPLIELIVPGLAFPALSKIKIVLSPVVGRSVALLSSTVKAVKLPLLSKVTALTLPALLIPALTGSFIPTTAPGLMTTPLSMDTSKVTTSVSLFSDQIIVLPYLAA